MLTEPADQTRAWALTDTLSTMKKGWSSGGKAAWWVETPATMGRVHRSRQGGFNLKTFELK